MTERGPDTWASPDRPVDPGPPAEPVPGPPGERGEGQPQQPPPPPQGGWGGPPSYGPPSYDSPPQYGTPQYGTPQYGAPGGWGGPPVGPPPPGVVPLRPLGLGELLDGAVGVVRRYPRPTLGLSLAVALLSTLLGLLLLLLLPAGLLHTTSTGRVQLDDAQVGGAAVGTLATTLITGLAGIVLSGVITAVVGQAVLGRPMSTGEAWRAVRPRLLRLVGLALLTGLAVLACLAAGGLLAVASYAVAGAAGLALGVPLALAGVVGGVYFYVRFALAAPALVLEKAGVVESLRRSGVLVRRSFWRVLGILVLAALVAGVVSEVVQIPFLVAGGRGLFGGTGGVPRRSLVLLQIGGGVATTLTAPFTSGVRALLYLDRRMRAEALDVTLAAAASRSR